MRLTISTQSVAGRNEHGAPGRRPLVHATSLLSRRMPAVADACRRRGLPGRKPAWAHEIHRRPQWFAAERGQDEKGHECSATERVPEKDVHRPPRDHLNRRKGSGIPNPSPNPSAAAVSATTAAAWLGLGLKLGSG